jgi:DNA-binding MarR family transcriptional regulator
MKNPTQSEKLFMMFQRGAIFVGRGRQTPHGGGHGQGYVLSLLVEAPLSQKELLEKLGVRAGSLSELLGKLESAGYITRVKDESDSRIVNVAITESGRAFAAEREQQRTQFADGLFSALDEDEKTTLIALLEKLHAAWRSEREADDAERRGRGHGERGGFCKGRGFGWHGGFGAPERGKHDHGDDHHGHHRRGEEITDPELKAYLETLDCGECDKNCKLSSPHCGKGAKKQRAAIEDFEKKSNE